MSQTIRNGQSIRVNIQTGEKLTAVAVTGSYSITVLAGTGTGTSLATGATGGTYGPYAYPLVVQIVASASSEIDYDAGVTTSIESDTVALLKTDPLTGESVIIAPDGGDFNISIGGSLSAESGNSNDHTEYFISLINGINEGKYTDITICAGQYNVRGSELPAILRPCTISGSASGVKRKASLQLFNDYGTLICNVENNSPTFTIGSNSTTIQNIRFDMTNASAPVLGSSAIFVNKQGSIEAAGISNKYLNVTMCGFYTNMDLRYGSEFEIRGCHIYNPYWVGIRVNNLVNYDMGDWVCSGNWFYTGAGTVNPFAALLWESCDGMIFTDNKVNDDGGQGRFFQYGLYVRGRKANGLPFPDGSIPVADFVPHICIISENSLENYLCGGIAFEALASSIAATAKIRNNEFFFTPSSIVCTKGIGLLHIGTAGTGYAVGDPFTLDGGTSTVNATGVVTAVSGGVVKAVDIVNNGVYSVMPTTNGTGNALSREVATTTTGGGTGLTVYALPAANIAIGSGARYDIGDNWSLIQANFLQAVLAEQLIVGKNSSMAGMFTAAAGIPTQSALEIYRCGVILDSTQWVDSAQGANRVLYVNNSSNLQAFSFGHGVQVENKFTTSVATLTSNSELKIASVGVSGFCSATVEFSLMANQDVVGTWCIRARVCILAGSGNNLPTLHVESASGFVGAAAATYTLNGNTLEFRSGAEGIDVKCLGVIGVSPQLTPKILLSVINKGTAGHNVSGKAIVYVSGLPNRVAMGDA